MSEKWSPDDLKWWQFQSNMAALRALIEQPSREYWAQKAEEEAYARFMAKVLKPLTKEDL